VPAALLTQGSHEEQDSKHLGGCRKAINVLRALGLRGAESSEQWAEKKNLFS
jgi:hypothetical protein